MNATVYLEDGNLDPKTAFYAAGPAALTDATCWISYEDGQLLEFWSANGECATADASGAALTLQLPEGPEASYLGPYSPQAPDEAKESQIGWLARATSSAYQAVTGSGGTAAAGSEEDEDDKGEAEMRASASAREGSPSLRRSAREADGDVDFTAERAPTRRRRSSRQRS